MMVPGFLHHIDLTVSDPPASQPLYEVFLSHAGFRLKHCGDDWAGWGFDGRRYPCITIVRARGEGRETSHDRYAPGLHHLALAARSSSDVDALYAKLLAFGAQILDPPQLYPDYGEGYYALFFADRDGLKLEYVFTPWPAETMAQRGP